MALTAYCKKCGREVEPGEICPRCGTRLGNNAAHAAWCVERRPVADWMYWNSVMRVLLPAALLVLLLVLTAEGLSGGSAAVEAMIASGFPLVLLLLLAGALAAVFTVLLLQGKELSDFVVDSRGIHETRYLPNPTKLKLIARLRFPAGKDLAVGDGQVIKLSERDLAWKNVSRVQLWPEKCMILLYAPAWWLRAPLVCTPFTWEDTMGLIREKLGKKRKILLPPSLVIPPAQAPRRTKPKAPLVPEVEEALRHQQQSDSRYDDLDPAEGRNEEGIQADRYQKDSVYPEGYEENRLSYDQKGKGQDRKRRGRRIREFQRDHRAAGQEFPVVPQKLYPQYGRRLRL